MARIMGWWVLNWEALAISFLAVGRCDTFAMLLDMPIKRKRIATLELPFRIDPSPKSSRSSEAVRDQAEPEQSLRITAAEIRNDPKGLEDFRADNWKIHKKASMRAE
jgi:hypothetical protein